MKHTELYSNLYSRLKNEILIAKDCMQMGTRGRGAEVRGGGTISASALPYCGAEGVDGALPVLVKCVPLVS